MWPSSLQATNFLFLALGIWLAIVSFAIVKTIVHYKKLMRGAKNQNLASILENILAEQNLKAKQISQISVEINKLKDEQTKSLQKCALVRFNPFEDTGGDQSFAVALLDGMNNGFVISSLHSRSGTRVYVKMVEDGKSKSHQFSKEEKEVVEKAARRV